MKSIDGSLLKKMLLSASNNLYNHYPEIDALNVFPVPDGDTGMNMNLTLCSGAKEIESKEGLSCYEIAKIFARGLLMGARGNSGAITSQIFKGFSLAFENKEDADAKVLAAAFKRGCEVSYSAVLKPVEGTILTVIRESSSALYEYINKNPNQTIEKAISYLVKAAKESLARTPELLPILKEVGVVDSGGAGLVAIFEGMEMFLKSGKIVEKNEIAGSSGVTSAAAQALSDEEYGYCTEFIMSLGPDSVKKAFNKEFFTDYLSKNGQSLVVVHDEDVVKVHVHTMTPGHILNFAQEFGEFLKIKIENMTEQHHALEKGATVEVHEDLVPEETSEEVGPKVDYAIIAVSSGDGIDEIFNEIGITNIVKGGQTMNPSSEDFLSAIRKANAKNIFILPNNSNIVMAASQACELVEDEDTSAFVIPSKTILQGIVSAITFNPDEKASVNFREMKSALKTVKSGEVTFSIRDCELNGVKIHKDDFIGIFEKDIVVGTKNKFECLLKLLKKMIDSSSSLITLIYGEDVSDDEAFEIKKKVEELYPEVNIDLRNGKQPVYSFLIGVE